MATTYAIISLSGKQYVVKEGENLLVDHLDGDAGKTFHPDVLFVGGDGGGELSPSTSVTAKVVGHERGPKIRIGKYKPKSGYKRHTGFRASLTRIEITGIGAATKTSKKAAEPKVAEPEPEPQVEAEVEAEAAAPEHMEEGGLPEGYGDMTVAQISAAAKDWDRPALEAALAYEQEHANRKGAVGALESALASDEKEES
jgi:large subunit ribosomal protein L21